MEDEITAAEYERVLNDLFDLSLRVPFDIKATEAPHYRRVQIERRLGIRHDGRPAFPSTAIPHLPASPVPGGEGIGRAPHSFPSRPATSGRPGWSISIETIPSS